MHHFKLLDVTEDRNHKNYEGCFVMKMNLCKHYSMVCADLFENHGLTYGDKIEVCWDSNSHKFKFKLIN